MEGGRRIETDVGHATVGRSGRARQIVAARGAEMEIGTTVPGGMIRETGETAGTARLIPLRDVVMPDALGLSKPMGRRLRTMRCVTVV